MKSAPVWTAAELERERLVAIEQFRRNRMEEPLEQYLSHFDEYQGAVEELLESTVDLTDFQGPLVQVLTDPKLLEAFRYLAGPPISEDDLKVVSEAVLSPTRLQQDQAMVQRIGQIVLSGLDRRRFPWVIEQREPTETEKQAAIIASAALLATRRLETRRRGDGKSEQEAAVFQVLSSIGFQQVPPRKVSVLSDCQ